MRHSYRLLMFLSAFLVSTDLSAQIDVSGRFDVISGATLIDSRYVADVGVPVTFRAIQNEPGFDYQWVFSDGGKAATQEVTYTFLHGGVATVQLTVTEIASPHHFGESQDTFVVAHGARGDAFVEAVPTPPASVVTRPTEDRVIRPPEDGIIRPPEDRITSVGYDMVSTDTPSGTSDPDSNAVKQGRIDFFLRRRGLLTADDVAAYEQGLVDYRNAQVAPLVCVCGHSTSSSIGPTNIAGRILSVCPHPTSTTTFLIGSAGGGLWETTNGGTSWNQYTACLQEMALGAVAYAPTNSARKYVVTGEYGDQRGLHSIGLLTTTDGSCWSLYGPGSNLTGDPFSISVSPTNELDLVIATTDGIFRSTTGGNGFTIERPASGNFITALVRHPDAVNFPLTLYAVQENHKLLVSADDGLTWTETGGSFPQAIQHRASLAVSKSNPAIMAVGTAVTVGTQTTAHIYRTTNTGVTWTDLPLGSLANYQTNGIGESQVETNNTISISPSNPSIMVAGGVTYIRTTNAGSTWSQTLSSGVHIDSTALVYNGTTLMLANDGGIWTSANDGSTATAENTGLQTVEFYSVRCDNSHRNRLFGGSQDNGAMLRTDAGGTTWNNGVPGADVLEVAINQDAPSVAYFSSPFGAPSRSLNVSSGFASFLQMTIPYGSQDLSTLLGEFDVPLAVDPGIPTTVYTGTYRVWKSVTGGDSWVALPTFPGNPTSAVQVIAIAPSSSSTMYVSTGSAFYKTTNGGSTWSVVSGLPTVAVNAVAIDPTNPSVVFVAMASPFLVYRTLNGGTNWIQQSSGLPSPPFAALSLQIDPGNTSTLWCGTDVGLFRSTNQGVSWSTGIDLYGYDAVSSISLLDDRTLLRIGTHGNGAFEESWVSSTNQPPTAVINGPSTLTVSLGTQMTFTGTTADSDGPVSGVWTFPDSWQRFSVAGGTTSEVHTFSKRSIFPFPVTLTAVDSSKARASAVVMVTVQ
jgi:photosystem II stability/assembly factor-like uncharacterized protein